MGSLTVKLEFTAFTAANVGDGPWAGSAATHARSFCTQIRSGMNGALVELPITYLGLAGRAIGFRQRVAVLGESFGLLVLQVKAVGHFATRIALVF